MQTGFLLWGVAVVLTIASLVSVLRYKVTRGAVLLVAAVGVGVLSADYLA